MSEEKKAIKGGEFLIRETDPQDIFIPEQWNEEQLMIAQTCQEFLTKEVHPNLDRIDNQEEGLMESLLEKAGELGLLGISVPEELGGFGKNFVTTMLSTEVTGAGHSYSVAMAAHTGIGTLPILYYGNEEQKAKYIPKLASGEWKACYCLTEPSSGSDANSGKTKATLSDDGKHYIVNGQKMWITNGGFADVFTVFAKIDDDETLSAFILEKDFEGLTLNPEEKKLGIKGSSTRQVFFNNVKVPVENMLSTRENGFKIALNILNIGRIKLAGAAMGGCKGIISQTINYANEREQFGRAISKYGAIRYKIAQQAIKTFATESATYRASQNIDDAIHYLVDTSQTVYQARNSFFALIKEESLLIQAQAKKTKVKTEFNININPFNDLVQLKACCKDDYIYLPLNINKQLFAVLVLCYKDQQSKPVFQSMQKELELFAKQVSIFISSNQQIADLQTSNKKLLKQDQLKSQLVSTISHELRTPMANILGFSELMKDLKLDQKHQEYNQEIHNSALRLSNLIDNFLDLSRIEEGHELELNNLEEIELDWLAERAWSINLASFIAMPRGAPLTETTRSPGCRPVFASAG